MIRIHIVIILILIYLKVAEASQEPAETITKPSPVVSTRETIGAEPSVDTAAASPKSADISSLAVSESKSDSVIPNVEDQSSESAVIATNSELDKISAPSELVTNENSGKPVKEEPAVIETEDDEMPIPQPKGELFSW